MSAAPPYRVLQLLLPDGAFALGNDNETLQ